MTRGGNDAHGPAFRISGTTRLQGKTPLACIVRRDFLSAPRQKRKFEKGVLSHEGVMGDKKEGTDGPCWCAICRLSFGY
jgi:hypothetical protein